MALSIVTASSWGSRRSGCPRREKFQRACPRLAGPALRLRDVEGIFPLAAGCLLLAYIEGVSAARTFAAKHGYASIRGRSFSASAPPISRRRMGHGYPVAGGLSQSAVNDKAGARTPLALVFASITLALCLLFLTGLLENLPKAVLAAVVLTAVYGLLDFPALLRMWRISRLDFYAAAIALGAVLLLGILQGILLAALGLHLVAAGADFAAARGIPRPHSRHRQLFGRGAPPRERAALRRDRFPSRGIADLRQCGRRSGSGLEPPSRSRLRNPPGGLRSFGRALSRSRGLAHAARVA